MTDESVERTAEYLRRRTAELRSNGFDLPEAGGIAWLEQRIRLWPPVWGDSLWALIYGDLEDLEVDLTFPELRIVVEKKPLQNRAIQARRVYKAVVSVDSKSVESLLDAARRVNILLGSWVLENGGNASVGWWSWVTHDAAHWVRLKLSDQVRPTVLAVTAIRDDDVRHPLENALYWLREAARGDLDRPARNILREYTCYWAAFENLVSATEGLVPLPASDRSVAEE